LLKINKLHAVLALAFAPFVTANELSTTGEFIDGVAAVVDDGVVLKSQLDEQLARILQRAQDQDIELPPAGGSSMS
jgi:peptidyl-prolyl cis-trans isomerase SurA